MGYLRRHDPAALPAARRAFRCFEPYGEDVQEYARATRVRAGRRARTRWSTCSRELRRTAAGRTGDGREAHFVAEQNALVVKNAEAYYRTMVRGGAGVVERPRPPHGRDAGPADARTTGRRRKAIVWEHNTHIGDARFTDMADDGEVNVGQLVRERHGDDGRRAGRLRLAPRHA